MSRKFKVEVIKFRDFSCVHLVQIGGEKVQTSWRHREPKN